MNDGFKMFYFATLLVKSDKFHNHEPKIHGGKSAPTYAPARPKLRVFKLSLD